ncbi:MAG: hypothetical protein JXR59_06620 [Desulfuromonadaceae bacterium]|nr:hypothetical protein [Desulfuromonadaceae bacterium]
MKRVLIALALMVAMAAPAFAVDFAFHGDLNHRFRVFTNQPSFFNGVDKAEKLGAAQGTLIKDDDGNDFMGEFKYRLWVEASSDEGSIKGVYAIEVGGVEFGRTGTNGASTGGAFSGDSVNVETRWAYVDFALAGGRAKLGLQTFTVNKFLWQETATGLDFKIDAGPGTLELAWMRGYEMVNTADTNDFEDLDALFVRYNLNSIENTKLGFFALWETSDAASGTAAFAPTTWYVKTFTGVDLDLYTLGIDGSTKAGNFFANWDLMYQFGDAGEEYDFGGYFGHVDLGMKMGAGKLTYTFWYASGDDDSTDDDLDAFVSTDVDINSQYSVVLFESLTDDDYFSASPYIQDKGLILNRLGYDHKVTDKLNVGVAALYLMTAEDIEYTSTNGAESEDKIGFEFDAYATYKLFSSTTVGAQFGYLAADDAMDYYEVDCDGNSDEDVYILTANLRYKF